MKTKIAAAAVAGALALTGTAAVAEAAPADKATTTSTDTTKAEPEFGSKEWEEAYAKLTPRDKWENVKDTVGRTELSSGAGIAAQAGLVTLVFSVAAMIAAFNHVELTWPGDPHHKRV